MLNAANADMLMTALSASYEPNPMRYAVAAAAAAAAQHQVLRRANFLTLLLLWCSANFVHKSTELNFFFVFLKPFKAFRLLSSAFFTAPFLADTHRFRLS